MNPRLFFKLALIPLRRSILLQSLMMLSFAQLLIALWFSGAIQKEITHTETYAQEARYLSVQLKEESTSVEPIRALFQDSDASFETLTTEEVLKKMETEEPDIVQTVRSIGNEGLQLMPRILIIRGVFPDEAVEKLKLMTEVSRVEVSPVHHARLLSFYHHLAKEIGVSVLVILFLLLVQMLVFQRIQKRDLNEVFRNLSAWGLSGVKARFPGFISLLILSGGAFALSIVEWMSFKRWVWKDNAFLGELSLSGAISLPYMLCLMVLAGIIVVAMVLSFSGQGVEEGEH